MSLREIEPFAYGFKEADISEIPTKYEREYRVACGFLSQAKFRPLSLNPAAWFVGPIDDMSYIHYDRGLGICGCDSESLQKQLERHSELTEEEKAELTELYAYFGPIRTHKITDENMTPVQHELRNNTICWADGGGHTNPDYEMLLRLGTDGLRKKIESFRAIHTEKKVFYDCLKIALSALDALAGRYRKMATEMLSDANAEDATVLKRILKSLEQVPAKSPRNFFEACTMFWMAFSFIGSDSPGNFDQFMSTYYLKDDPADRYTCLKKLWDLFHATRAWNLCIGGSNEFGNDLCNDLTYDVLRVAREYKYNTPNITMRFHKDSPEKAWYAAAETLATGIGMPAIYNDDVVCSALEALGIPASDSHRYCMNGCNQIDIFGKSHMGLEDGEINVSAALEFVLYNGFGGKCQKCLGLRTGNPADFQSFDELLNAFFAQADHLIDVVVEMSNKFQKIYAEEAPYPWMSCLIQGCIEKGQDFKNCGPIYGNGQILTEALPDAVDSLIVLKHFVFDTHQYTMDEVVKALRTDYEGYEEMRLAFVKYHKFGNDLEDVDILYGQVSDHLYRHAQTHSTFRGGRFGLGCSTYNRSARYGRSLAALPNGKKADDYIISESIGATPGCDCCGPTALLNSVLHANQRLATSGNVLQMKFNKGHFCTEKGLDSFIALAKTYFRLGGQTLQINVLSTKELKDALIHPERHNDLVVRVGGYSAYFNSLERGLQENIIARSEVS